jgi:hypothetical protein
MNTNRTLHVTPLWFGGVAIFVAIAALAGQFDTVERATHLGPAVLVVAGIAFLGSAVRWVLRR